MTILVGRQAPEFTAPAVLGSGEIVDMLSFEKARNGKHAVILFYPLDFTFVCPSELIALDKRINEFSKIGVKVFSISIDSHFTHHAWRNTPTEKGGVGQVKFTMFADINRSIVRAYGISHPELGVAFRSTFLIDKDGIVRHQLINDLPLGRNMDELLRISKALQFFEKNGEVCPAGWEQGSRGMKASPEGVAEYMRENIDLL